MSHIGKLSRGYKWHLQKTIKGYPDGIASDEGKMVDIEYFLNHCKVKKLDHERVGAALMRLRAIQRAIFPVKNKMKLVDHAMDIIEGKNNKDVVEPFSQAEAAKKAEV